MEAGAAPALGAALGQHGDLGAEVGPVAAHGGVVIFHVGAQEPLHVPPSPLPLQLGLDLKKGARKGRGQINWGREKEGGLLDLWVCFVVKGQVTQT